MSTRTFTFNVTAPAASGEAWVPATANQWTTIANTKMLDAMAGYAAPAASKLGITAYCGGCMDQTGRKLYYIGGGHADYGGNECLRLDLSLDAPAWSVIGPYKSTFNPQAAPTPNVTANADYYIDSRDSVQRPASRHTYWSLSYTGGLVILPAAYAVYGSGNFHYDQTDAFSTVTNDYVARGTYSACPVSYGGAGRSSTVDGGGNVWVWNNRAARLDSGATAWTDLGVPTGETTPGGTLNGCVAFDTTNNRILRSNPLGWRVLNVVTNTVSTPANIPASVIGGQLFGTFHYSSSRNAYIFINPATRLLYWINADTFAVTPIATTGTPPASRSEGSYLGNFLWLESLSVAVVVEQSVQADVKVIKVA